MKTGALWAIASALFLISCSLNKSGVLYDIAIVYCILSIVKAGWES